MKTRNFLYSGGASPLAYTEIVAYTRSSEAKFLDPNFIRSSHTAWAESGHSVDCNGWLSPPFIQGVVFSGDSDR